MPLDLARLEASAALIGSSALEADRALCISAEAVEALAIKADGTYVDATFGRGGHSRRILSCLNEQGRLVARAMGTFRYRGPASA